MEYRISKDAKEFGEDLGQVINENLSRVDSLLEVYENQHLTELVSGQVLSDLLRSAVILLHSAIEELFRSLEYFYFKQNLPLSLKDLGVFDEKGKQVSLNFETLYQYREMRVDEFIDNCIKNQAFTRLTISNTTKISVILRKIGIESTEIRKTYKVISQLLSRRHSIVHHGDRKILKKDSINEISVEEVKTWRGVIIELVAEIIIEGERKFGGQKSE